MCVLWLSTADPFFLTLKQTNKNKLLQGFPWAMENWAIDQNDFEGPYSASCSSKTAEGFYSGALLGKRSCSCCNARNAFFVDVVGVVAIRALPEQAENSVQGTKLSQEDSCSGAYAPEFIESGGVADLLLVL